MKNRAGVLLLSIGIFLVFPLSSAAQWEQTNGPGGNTVYTLAVVGTKIFAGTGGGVFITADGGASWKSANTGLPEGRFVYCLGVSGPNVLAGASAGLYYSSNEGANWALATAGLPPDVDIKCFAEIGPDLFAGTGHRGIFLSRDHGLSWTAAGPGLPGRTASVDRLVALGPVLFAVSRLGGIFVSLNSGNSWAAADLKLSKAGIVTCLAVSGGQLVAAATRGIYVSSDNGMSWKEAKSGFPNDGYITCLGVIGPDILTGTSEGAIFVSTDNGSTWTAAGSGLPTGRAVNCLAVSGTTILAGIDPDDLDPDNIGDWSWSGGVYRSDDGGATWKASNPGLANTCIWHLLAIGPYLFAGWSTAVGALSTDGGDSWVPVDSVFSGLKSVMAHAEAGPFVFAVTNKGIVRFRDKGTSWDILSPVIPVKFRYTDEVKHLAACGPTLFASTTSQVFQSDDYGASWREVKIKLPTPRYYGAYIRELAVAGEDLFALVEVEEESAQLYISPKDGNKWRRFIAFPGTITARRLAVSGNKLLVGGWNGVYSVTHDGTKAEFTRKVGTDFGEGEVFGVRGTTVIAVTRQGAVFSTDSGETWAALPAGSPRGGISALELGESYLYAGTLSSGVWRLPLSQVPVSKK
jgi:photosystem II stability/assembly factor-like uncharacterized protein